MNSHLPPSIRLLQLLLTPYNGSLKDSFGGFYNLGFVLCTKVPGLAASQYQHGAEWQSQQVGLHISVAADELY